MSQKLSASTEGLSLSYLKRSLPGIPTAAVLDSKFSLLSQHQISKAHEPTLPYLVVSGFCAQVIESPNRRHIVGMSVAGDVVNLEVLLGERPSYGTVTIGPVQLAQIDVPQTSMLDGPEMRSLIASHALRAASNYRLWAYRSAALEAPQSIAHLLCEIRLRLAFKGLADRVLRTPFTQTDIADMCGISAIHANRAFSRLRDGGFGEMRRGDFYASDWSSLAEFAQFDPRSLGPMSNDWR